MSEHHYNEFQAIDRPLGAKEMSELRAYSTRALITTTSFVNHYEWGSFKGDEDLWMEKYFDAFLYRDLLSAAAENSKPLGDTNLGRYEARAWVGRLGATEKDALIVDLMLHNDCVPLMELLQRFLKEQSAKVAADTVSRRPVTQLLREAETRKEKQKLIETQMRAEAKARHEREGAISREKHLLNLIGREQELWAEVETLITTAQPKSYDQAVKILVDLRDLDARGKSTGFEQRMKTFQQGHARKPSFTNKLRKAGL